VLPIEILDGSKERIMARYDTGTYENHMSLGLATTMGFELDYAFKISLNLPNGTSMYSLGRVTASLRFLQTHAMDPARASVFTCCFNVFDKLISPVLLGMNFLAETETLSKYTHRLKAVPKHAGIPKRILSMGDATSRVSCMIDGKFAFAHADTGSEIALVDMQYVQSHCLDILPGCEAIMFADGSIDYTQGSVNVLLTLPGSGLFRRASWQKVTFHIMEGCSFDLIFDEGLVEACGIFSGSCASLEMSTYDHMTSLASIIHLGAVEKAIVKAKVQVQNLIESAKSFQESETTKRDYTDGKCSQLSCGRKSDDL
jgi:hypothetical protein